MSHEPDETNERILASAIHYLYQIGEKEAANLLLTCRVEKIEEEDYWHDDMHHHAWNVLLRGSPIFYKKYHDVEEYDNYGDTPLGRVIREAFQALLSGYFNVRVQAKIELLDIDTDWRTRLLAEAETTEISNQNPFRREPLIWQGMKFDSPGEVKIAKELDRRGIMFFPTCLARVGTPGNRQNRIPDFLICYKGKWGILEIDGKTYHTAQNATADHDRRRIIQQHGGIAWFDRFTHEKCMNEPEKVVDEFLSFLANN